MKFQRREIGRLLALSVLLLSMNARADWAQSSDVLVVKPGPANGQVQAQNPPGFTWARHAAGPAQYEIEITLQGAAPVSAVVERNWYLPTTAMARGNYSWRVRPVGSTDWSAARTFVISALSNVFEVPDNTTLKNRIIAKGHPRSLPPSFFDPMSGWKYVRSTALVPYVSRMGNEVKAQILAMPALSDARWSLAIAGAMTAAMNAQQTDIRNRINEASRQLQAAAVMWHLKKEQLYLNEALRMGDQLAALSPTGPTSYANQDQATREIALGLAKALDVLARDIDPVRRAAWLSAITVRTNEIYANLAGDNGRLDQFPFDSHANTSMIFVVLISSLTLGDIPEAQKWFDFSFRAYANSPSPWSGPEGGYANGTAYAEYTAGYLVSLWDPLVQATGINFYGKPWAIGLVDFATEFTPPGARTHVFGDASETRPDARVFHAFAARQWSPRAAWYVKNLGGTEDTLSLLQAPYPMPVASTTYLSPPSNSAYYPSIGWVAMHSDLGSPGRTSVYFKSSPYGSFNHSHGDQNGFLLTVAGQPLLIKSGWYDWYGSPNWLTWYRQTKSQNAITFDGGKGQLVDGYRETLQRNGRITSFSAQPTYDYAQGDATPSYGGQLSMAKRQLWYLRTANAVLVRDRLASSVPRNYEFNLHAPTAIVAENASNVKIAINGQSVCVRSLGAGSWAARTGAIVKPGVVEDHGAFEQANDGKSTAEFLLLLDVGCKRPVVSTGFANGARTVTVGTQTVALD
jgi:hypothetical protein